MKKTIFILITFFTISCKAQQIKDKLTTDTYAETGVYYKDISNALTPFVGVYTYANGSKTFKIELRKMERSSVNGRYFEDMLIGAYEYKDGNTIIASTFDNLNNNYDNGTNNKLYARHIFIGDWPGCDVCSTDAIWMNGLIKSVINIGGNEIRFKKVVENGQEALRVLIMAGGVSARHEGDPIPVPQPASYPCCEEFVMIKQ